MKKFWQFLQANSNAIIVIELVIIISLFIKHFNVKLINDTIIPIAYLVSVYFIFMAFKENQRSNVIEVGGLIYKKYFEEIENIVKWLDRIEPLKHEFRNKFRSVLLKSNDYSGISEKTNQALKIIKNTPEYKVYIERINKSDDKLKHDWSLVSKDLINDYSALRKILSDFSGHVGRFMIIYENILLLKDSLAKEQIYILCRELDKYLKEYYRLCESILQGDSLINVEAMIEVTQTSPYVFGDIPAMLQQRLFSKVYPSDFLTNYNRISEIRKKLNMNV